MKAALPITLLALFLCLPLQAADAPATTINGGILARAIDSKATHQIEWFNSTQHKLKFSYSLTVVGGAKSTGSATLSSKQRLTDPNTSKSARITDIHISDIEIVN